MSLSIKNQEYGAYTFLAILSKSLTKMFITLQIQIYCYEAKHTTDFSLHRVKFFSLAFCYIFTV